MASCLINPLKEAGKCIWPTVKPHFDYWWCFDGNVQVLRDEIDCLERERRNMDLKIEEARLRAEIATPDVNNWSNEGTQKLVEATTILQGCDDLKVWKIKSRYLVGKRAKEIAESIAKFRNKGNTIRIAVPAPPAAMVPITHAPTFEFQSRKSIEEDIMESLKDGNVRMIAICGAGGVGKTTMAQRIEDRVRGENLFDEVVNVVVSQPIDKFKIQKQIAEILRLDLIQETSTGRAHELRTRLMDSKKKLIIFDDVWESFKVEDIGVPFGGCKIILTSRLKGVCEEMEANKVTEIQLLDKKEAWTLFREKSGDCVDDLYLHPIAKDVAAECKGLPIALVTVGKALQKKNINTWKDALLQLREANPTNFPQVLKNVYIPLKLSYDFLESESEKSLFLLCCLFPEDYNIRIEDLALLSFGLGMFAGINNIEDGRNRTYHLLEALRSRYLLMPGSDEDEVKMHDVVRDVAIFIGSKDKKGFLKSLEVSSKDSSRNCNWMSVEISNIANAKLPVGLDFPNLLLLMILNSSYSEGFDVNDICFKGMEELTVLYFSNQKFKSLPSSLKFLKKLRKLHLNRCEVKDISIVGELTSLEILRILGCNDIEELPANVRELKLLRLLELRDCEKLKRIVGGVISSLVGLEELKIVDCFDKWEAKGNVSEERNASVSELESLRNLTSLEIDISDPNVVAQDVLLSEKLKRYQIHSINEGQFFFDVRYRFSERKIALHLERGVTVGNWIQRLAKNTQSLALGGDGSNYFNLGEIESLRKLLFKNCSTVEKLANAVVCKFPMGSNSFQNLESISIYDCPNLRYLFSMATARSLVKLESLEISFCEKMEQVLWNEMESSNTEEEASIIIEFPKLKTLDLSYLPNLLGLTQLGVEIIKFPQLTQLQIIQCPKLRIKIHNGPTCMIMIEVLRVSYCDAIEEIFRDDGNRHITFQELRELKLEDLQCLTTFYKDAESITFPKLKKLAIGNLARLNSFVEIEDSEADTHDLHSLHFFCNKKAEVMGLKILRLNGIFSDKIFKIWCCHIPISFFHDLESLEIYKVDGIKNLITSSIAIALVNLKELKIWCCQEIIEVIEEETHVCVNSVFQNLQHIDISECPNLRYLFSMATARSLVQLESLEIWECEKMEQVLWNEMESSNTEEEASIIIEFPKLKTLSLYKLPNLLGFTTQLGVEIIKFPQLIHLQIMYCPKLRTHDHHSHHFFCNKKVEIIGLKILSLKNLPDKICKIWCCHIPISFFHDLERLDIYKVDGIKNLISSSIAIALVNLKKLKIERCQEIIEVIEEGKHVFVNSVFQNLQSIEISLCPNLRYLFSMATARSLVHLEILEIRGCKKMEQVLWNEMESSNTEEEASIIIEFPKLKALLLSYLPNLLGFTQLGVEIIKFPQLTQLHIGKCPKLRTKIDNYPTCMIEKLWVQNRDNIEEIFRDDGNRHITFQELRVLGLLNLQCLTTFYKGAESIKFPKLKELRIGNLPRLNSFVEIEDSEHIHNHHSLHFFCNKKAEVMGLKRLLLRGIFSDKIFKIWCCHIPISFFHDLESLEIYNIDGIKNLLSSSIAIALVNLKELKIAGCQEIIDIIEDETHVTDNSVFPNLKSLQIANNCKLRSFCQWKHAFELPSLDDVQIDNCPLMKTFTLGSLSTPKLHRFRINKKDIEMKDLNDGIHHFVSTEVSFYEYPIHDYPLITRNICCFYVA